jgi:FYVE/RhoGEF/PH domain-containing protein 3
MSEEPFNPIFREHVIKEVLQTEEDYVKDMNLLISLFLTPILERGILSANEVQRLFSNISSLIKINEGKNSSIFRSILNI